jgi:hypothetical protein
MIRQPAVGTKCKQETTAARHMPSGPPTKPIFLYSPTTCKSEQGLPCNPSIYLSIKSEQYTVRQSAVTKLRNR